MTAQTILGIILGLAAIALGTFGIVRARSRRSRCTAATTGTVIEVREHHSRNRKTRTTYTTYRPVVEYAVDGERYRREPSSSSQYADTYQEGDELDLLYDPDDPTNLMLARDGKGTTTYLPAGLALIAMGAYLVIRAVIRIVAG